jgi:probable phosphoglycerate mutase
MLLVCVRHLKTVWNHEGRLQGQRDIDLMPPDEEALAAIRENRKRIAALGPFDTVLASALRRTQQTANHYGVTEFKIEPLADEINFGPYEGKPSKSLVEDFGARWTDDPRDLEFGESLLHLEARIRGFLRKYKDREKVLLFAHGSWLRALVSIAECGDVRNMNTFFIVNNEVRSFEFEADDPVFGGPVPAGAAVSSSGK